jgi:hypothetical protein
MSKITPILINQTFSSGRDENSAFVTVDEFSRRVGFNTGNLVFLYGLFKVIENLKSIINVNINELDDYIKIWGCSNFLNPKKQMFVSDSYIYTDNKPMILLGLGAQAENETDPFVLGESNSNWLSVVDKMRVNQHSNIAVRGDFTKYIIDDDNKKIKPVILGCPSLFINPDKNIGLLLSRRVLEPMVNIAVLPGPWVSLNKRSMSIERMIVEFAEKYNGDLIFQSNINIFKMYYQNKNELDDLEIERLREFIKPNLNNNDFYFWFRRKAKIFDNVPTWIGYLKSLNFVIGNRIHGVALSLQSGTPAICITTDARQEELCKTMFIPYIQSNNFNYSIDIDACRELLIKHDWQAFDTNRKKIAELFVEFLDNNSLESTNQLKVLSGMDIK